VHGHFVQDCQVLITVLARPPPHRRHCSLLLCIEVFDQGILKLLQRIVHSQHLLFNLRVHLPQHPCLHCLRLGALHI